MVVMEGRSISGYIGGCVCHELTPRVTPAIGTTPVDGKPVEVRPVYRVPRKRQEKSLMVMTRQPPEDEFPGIIRAILGNISLF